MPLVDFATSQPCCGNHICAPSAQLFFHGRTLRKITFRKDKRLSLSLPRKLNFNVGRDALLIKAVYTLEHRHFVQTQDGEDDDHTFLFDSDSNLNMFQSSDETSSEVDEKEKLRRMRISTANKGNVPWNKGRKHRPETVRLIRERTRLAMQDPKVKMKLVNLGHAQTEETRAKIGVGVRMGWQRRREKLLVQETCHFEWQNLIADASRRGFGGEKEMQWDSYRVLDKQLEQEWLDSIEQRKSTPRSKGNKRAPKSPEQRRKISEAISAKWNDPDYRERVCSALEKYHGVPVGTKKREPRKRPTRDTEPIRSQGKRRVKEDHYDSGSERKINARTRKRTGPKYKDPLADSKLEMIKSIRAQRMAMETKKIEAIERARLLIAEAEKAAKALEVAALKSPLARASLIETRKLIAEATQSLEAIEKGQVTSYEKDNHPPSKVNGQVNHFGEETDSGDGHHTPPSVKVNGTHVPIPNSKRASDINFGEITVQDVINHRQGEESTTDRNSSHPFRTNTIINQMSRDDQQTSPFSANGALRTGSDELPNGTGETSETLNLSKKWISGRLVEVSDSILEHGESVEEK